MANVTCKICFIDANEDFVPEFLFGDTYHKWPMVFVAFLLVSIIALMELEKIPMKCKGCLDMFWA